MTQIQLDDLLRQKLGGAAEFVEILDETGAVVGHFVPLDAAHRISYANVQIPYDDEEIERRRRQTGGSTLVDFWQRMGRK